MGVDADIDITTEDCKTVLALLQRHLPCTTAWVYGSRVKWTSRPQSDLDLVVFATPEQRPQVGDLREAFEESNLPFRVDLFVWDEVPDSFRERIATDHVVLAKRRDVSDGAGDTSRTDGRDFGTGHVACEAEATTGRADTWPIMSLSEAGVSLIDCEHRTPPSSEHGYPYVGIPQIKDGRIDLNDVRYITHDDYIEWTRKANPQPFDIVLSRRCNPGDTGFVPPGLHFALGQNLVLLRSDGEKVLKPFLRWLVSSPEWWTQVGKYINVGAVFDSLKCVDIPGFRLPIPPLPVQRAIAHILGTLDDKIELNRRMNATLAAMVRALFRSWFVDFDPVRAKMAGRDTELPKDIADLFPDRLVESELGEMPLGWPVESLGHHFEAVKGVSYKGSGLGGDGAPLHNLNSVHEGGGYKYEGIKFYSGEYAERHRVRPGDVIVANTEQGHDRLLIGYAAIVPRVFGNDGIASHHIYRLRRRRASWLSTRFLLFLLNSTQMHDLVSRYANGTTVNMLPIDGVQRPPIPVPPKALVETFDSVALWSEHRREESVRESRILAILRDTLLPKLVSGELPVNVGDLTSLDARNARNAASAAIR